MTKKGRTYRIRREKRRKVESKDRQFTLTLIDLAGSKKEINIFPYEYIGRYHNKIIELFGKHETSIKFDIIKNRKLIDINKILYSQNIYKNQELTIIFSTLTPPLTLFEPYNINPLTIQTYNRILDDIITIINTDPLPNDIYFQIKNVFYFTRDEMKMRWFDYDIISIYKYSEYFEGVKSRHNKIYRSYCPHCLEGSNANFHNCLIEAVRFKQMLPKLLQILNETEPYYFLTF